jgi:tRNA-Thr(GGU) m(6)t(6)A37 methyltransferase TsaA
MTHHAETAAIAREIIESNLYMTLATADEVGRPWASPVYYASAACTEFFWVSSPDATHSRNLAIRPELGIVIFDSRAPVNSGQGVYMSARASQPMGAELDRGLTVFSRRSQAHGAGGWAHADVRSPAPLRLYRATVSEHSVLGAQSRRIPVSVAGAHEEDDRRDHRATRARFEVKPIGVVESPLTDPASAPKQGHEGVPDAWLIFEPGVLNGLQETRAGDRVILITWLDRARRDVLRVHPRDDATNPERGVFSTRSADRPNPIGLHEVEIASIEGRRARVRDLEAVNGTPILDVKPVLGRP